MLKRIVCCTALLLAGCAGLPESGGADWRRSAAEQRVLFADEPVVMHLEVDKKLLETTMKSRKYVSGSLSYKGRLWKNIGVRYRGGNFSRGRPKRAFKLKFNTVRGRTFFGLRRLNFNMQRNDPTFVREKIVCEMMRGIGLPSPRIGYVRLYFNGKYRGLYLNVEQIDRVMMADRFGQFNGILYKAGWPACFRFKPKTGKPEVGVFPVKELYGKLKKMRKRLKKLQKRVRKAKKAGSRKKVLALGRRVVALRKEYAAAQKAPLSRFITLLNTADPGRLQRELPQRFDVDAFLKILAVHSLTASWDTYYMTPGNFYLYWNRGRDRMCWIPYDYDNTLGIDFFQVDWAKSDILDFIPRTNGPEDRPLIDKILAVPAFKRRYLGIIGALLKSGFRYPEIKKRAEELQRRIAPWVKKEMDAKDNYRKRPGGYRAFRDNLNRRARAGYRSFAGLLPFVRERVVSVRKQLSRIKSGRGRKRLLDNGTRSRAALLAPALRDSVLPKSVHWYRIRKGAGGRRALLLRSGSAKALLELYSGGRLLKKHPLRPGLAVYPLPEGTDLMLIRSLAPFSIPVSLGGFAADRPVVKLAGGQYRFTVQPDLLQLKKLRSGKKGGSGSGEVKLQLIRRRGRKWNNRMLKMACGASGEYTAALPLTSGKYFYRFVIPGFGPVADPSCSKVAWSRFSVLVVE